MSHGPGSAVTGRFITRQVDRIARVQVLSADGQTETLEGTTIHPIWSLDRDDWVELGGLDAGEQLSGQAGPATVLSLAIQNHPTAVYNIEVHGEHVYQVGELGLLVHNACAGFNDEMSKAIGWLRGHGFNASKAKPFASKFSDRLNGLRDGNIGYRIEFDLRSGAHINVFAGKLKGPHFQFPGNESDVLAIIRQLFGT